jgi:hypothetical protein
MGTEVALLYAAAVAFGSAIVLGLLVFSVIILCLRAMRQGSDFEGEVRHHRTTFRLRAGASVPGATRDTRDTAGLRKMRHDTVRNKVTS